MRALLIVNPHATSATQLRLDVIASALSSAVELEVVQTRYRGHATRLAGAARSSGFGLVLTLGGDGTVNEAVNGIMGDDGPAGGHASAASVPAFAALPSGSANVFTQALGLPADPVDAAGQILQALSCGRYRSIGLGLAGDRYFTVNAGLGMDAEVVHAVEGHRALGRTATAALYVRTAVRQFYRATDRQHPALTLERDGHLPAGPLFLGIVSNVAPWTYLGRRPVYTNREAAFDTGLDLFALWNLRTLSTLRTVRQMIFARRQAAGRNVLTLHDQGELRLRAARPVAFQVDGEYVGEQKDVRFLAVPDALRVVA